MLNRLLLLTVLLLTGCNVEMSASIKRDQLESQIAQLVEADSIDVTEHISEHVMVSIVGLQSFEMTITERDKLAQEIVDICAEEAANTDGISIIFFGRGLGSNTAVYNWSTAQKQFVEVITTG